MEWPREEENVTNDAQGGLKVMHREEEVMKCEMHHEKRPTKRTRPLFGGLTVELQCKWPRSSEMKCLK